MTDIMSENELCVSCDAEIRPGAQFCYSCGIWIEPGGTYHLIKPGAMYEKHNNNVSDVWLRGNINDEVESDADSKNTRVQTNSTEAGSESKDVSFKGSSGKSKSARKKKAESAVKRKPGIRSAASFHKKRPGSMAKRKLEIVWKKKEDSPNAWFILVSVFLTLFVCFLFYMAISLK